MWPNLKKFTTELALLKSLKKDSPLPIARQEILKAQLLAKLDYAKESGVSGRKISWATPRYSRAYAVVPLVLVMFISGTIFASAHALPGEPLYTVKRLKEKVEVAVAASETARAKLEAKHAEARLAELTAVAAKIDTVVEAEKTEEKEQVEKLEIAITNDTQAQLEKALNVLVEVEGKLEVKGQNEAATKIKERITQLAQQATETRFEVVKIKNGHERFEVKIKPKRSRNQDRLENDNTNHNRSDNDDNNAPNGGDGVDDNDNNRQRGSNSNNDTRKSPTETKSEKTETQTADQAGWSVDLTEDAEIKTEIKLPNLNIETEDHSDDDD